MAYLSLINLNKKYGKKSPLIIKDLSLDIERGEFIVFLGPSGCGKTTVIRMIAGLEEATSGDIKIEGKSILNAPPKDKGVSMIFQSYAVWPHMTVFENIAYPLKFKKEKMSKVEIAKRVKAAATITNIEEYLNRYPAQLSGGQRQRVAVSRAIVGEPKIFLMDEPLSNLDAMLRVSTRTELKNIHKKLGAVSIFVTHDQSEAMSLADRIAVMKEGVIEQFGTASEVYNDCESVFVASFIGSPPTNFFEVLIEEKAGELWAVNDLFRFKLNLYLFGFMKAYTSKKTIVGIRPENFTINSDKDSILFKKKPDFVEPQGSHIILILRFESGKENSHNIYELKIVSQNMSLDVQQNLSFGIKEDKIMFFNSDTKKRIREEKRGTTNV